MPGYQYLDTKGRFQLENPDLTSYLYFPIANESGVLSCVTPSLAGDNKIGQNSFLLAPVSSEDLHSSKSTRNFWCQIEGKGAWSATGQSAMQVAELFTEKKDKVVLEAGILWHKITRISSEIGIKSVITSFVPASSDQLEVMVVEITNVGEAELTFTPTVAIPFYARSADNIRDHRHVTSLLHRTITTEQGVLVDPTLTFDERGHHKNTVVYGIFACSELAEKPTGFFPLIEEFIGEGGAFDNPRAVMDETIKVHQTGEQINGYEALGGIRFKKTSLGKGASKIYVITMGYGDSKEALTASAMKYRPESFEKKLTETRNDWNEKINITYESADSDFDSWMNWIHAQPILRRMYGCSFLPHHDYGRGGRGWRDLWQDCLALLVMNPAGVRKMLLDNFGGVRIDGTNATIIGNRQGEFIADRNQITRVWMDHGVWPFVTTELYIQQTGDLSILLKKCAYFKDPQAVRGEETDECWDISQGNQLRTEDGSIYEGTILEHLLIQNLTAFYDVGGHNIMRLHGADWNDALDMAGEQGESVAFTSFYSGNLRKLAELIRKLEEQGIKEVSLAKEITILLERENCLLDNPKEKQAILKSYCRETKSRMNGETFTIASLELAENLIEKAESIAKHIQTTEWIKSQTGHSWYNGYYDNHAKRVEGDFAGGVRMMLPSQVFPIMSGVATDEQIKDIVKAADAYLYEKSLGGYRLNTNFHEIKTDMGRMFGFAYGHKENGAVFSHMAVMYGNALYQRGFVKEGYKVIDSLYKQCNDFEKSRIYPGIPEYFNDKGRGMYHYLTGAASWMLVTVLTEMYGVKGSYGDLLVEPKLLKEQFDKDRKTGVSLTFAGRKLHIIYRNDHEKEYGEYKIQELILNGKKIEKNSKQNTITRQTILALEEEKIHELSVVLE